MSLRPTIARTLLRPRATTTPTPLAAARGIASSSPRRAAGAGHEEHRAGAEEDSSTHTHESFFSGPWRNTLILITASVLIYPYLPSPQKFSASPSVSPDAFSSAASDKSDAPLITRLLAKYTPESKVWTERNDKHLELSKEKAEERLLFQEAERPKVHRMRYPSHFEQASPHCLPVGGSIDLSDLQVKRT